MFQKRREAYLFLADKFEYVQGSSRVTPFGSDSVTRKGIITASGAANILGRGYMSRQKYMDDLFNNQEVRGFKSETSDFLMTMLRHGKTHEPAASDAFFRWMGNTWEPIGTIQDQMTYTVKYQNNNPNDPDDLVIGATPDMLIWNPMEKRLALLEIKCPYTAWARKDDLSCYDNACSLLSDKHFIQCQVQMLVMQIPQVYLFFYSPSRDVFQTEDDINACTWLIKEDKEFQRFLLSNIHQVYKEAKEQKSEQFKLFMREGQHNGLIIHESKMSHSTFLIP